MTSFDGSRLVRTMRSLISSVPLDGDEPRKIEGTRFSKDAVDEGRVGVCYSGGGIRSAAYCLGVTQRLKEAGFWTEITYLSAVSGGAYIAAAEAITRTKSDPGALEESEAWSRGSPEAHHLRTNADYLAPGFRGQWWFGLNALWGACLNLLPILLASTVIGGGLAVLLRPTQPGLQNTSAHDPRQVAGDVGHVELMPEPAVAAGVLLIFSIVLVSAWRWFLAGRAISETGAARSRRWARRVQWAADKVRLAVGAVVGLFIALPLAVWLARIASAIGWHALRLEPVPLRDLTSAEVPTNGASYLTTAILILALLLVSSVAVALARRSRAYRTMLVLAGLAGPLLVLIPGLAMAHRVFAVQPELMWEYLLMATSAVVCVAMAVMSHNGRYSMHLYYRDRLSGVFNVKRNADGTVEALGENHVWFSEVRQEEGHPQLIICAALNVSDRLVPRGRHSSWFVFTSETCESGILGRSAELAQRDEQSASTAESADGLLRTAEFELSGGLGSPRLTLPSLVATSGAALSPVMGRLTVRPLRFLLAMLNVRLGVWVPNPSAKYRQERVSREWARLEADQSRAERRSNRGKEVTRRVHARYPHASYRARLWRHIADGWREPGAYYVWREATGSLALDRRFVYITDGGHWDNLGLFELVRRRCRHILCFDASLDPNDRFEALRSAVALCRSDLAVDIDIDPRPLERCDRGVAETDTVAGSISYPDGQEGTLVYSRATICADTAALLQLHAQDHAFPDHKTGDQFFTDEEFEAFRALGYDTALRTVQAARLTGFRPKLERAL